MGTRGPEPRGRARVTRLTPERIRAAQFARTPLGRRGLAEDEVRRFLDHVADEIALREAADAANQATIDHYKHALARWQAEHNDELTGAHGPSAEAVDILTRAQREADAYVAEAREYGHRIVAGAQAEAARIVADARARAASGQDRTPARTPPPAPPGRSQLLWTRTFLASLHNVETQLRSAREALSCEFDRLGPVTSHDARIP